MKISAVILTKNEEKNIERVIKSVKFCDQIIIIDDFSNDKTVEIAKNLGAVIFQRKINADFAVQRNFGIEKAKYEWILFIDADEEVTRELKIEISRVILNSFQDPNQIPKQVRNDMQAYYIKRRDFFWGRELKYGETKKIRQVGLIRLIRKNSGKWVGKVHEEFKIDKSVGQLKSYLNHYPHPTVKEFLRKINYYSTVRAKELMIGGESASIWKIIFFPFLKFILTYFIKLGFLDGPAGFTYAFFMSFHSFLVRVKLYQYTKINLKKMSS